MYMNPYQECIRDLLDEYGALLKRQLLKMVNLKLNTNKPNIDGYVSQMCRYGDYTQYSDVAGDIVSVKGVVPDYDVIRSFDVMLAFMPRVKYHRRSRDYISISFIISTETHEKELFVVPVKIGMERSAAFFADDKFSNLKSEVVIFLLEDKKQIKSMHAGCNHKLAVIDKDGVKILERKKF